MPADKEWLLQVAQICKSKNILLIIDEIQTGMGRTGTLYSFEQYGIEPDIFTLAKGLGNGLPVGAMLGKKELAVHFSAGVHGSTFGGNKVVMAAANAVLDLLQEPNFFVQVQAKSRYFQALLFEKVGCLESVTAIRGLGLMLGIETTADIVEAMKRMEEDGLLVLRAGTNVIRLLPALTISKDEITVGVNKIAQILNEMEKKK